jgi:hypothetical protein
VVTVGGVSKQRKAFPCGGVGTSTFLAELVHVLLDLEVEHRLDLTTFQNNHRWIPKLGTSKVGRLL